MHHSEMLCYGLGAFMSEQVLSELKVNEAAKRARVHAETIRVWIRNGWLPATKKGGQWRVKTEDLDKMDTRQIAK
jgi:excisionase family DNA binding protein